MLSILSSLKPSRLVSAACTAVAACAMMMGVASCSMMHDDLDPCPTRDTGLFVRFVYDYNTQRADMFKDHVGYVQLNIFDEAGKLVAQRKVSNNDLEAPLQTYGYTMYFSNDELPAGHKYRLQAIGLQKDWDEANKTAGAKYRMLNTVTDTASVRIALDRDLAVVTNTQLHPVSTAAPLDTLWHTLKVTTDGILDKADWEAAAPAPARTVAPYSIYPVGDQFVSVEEDRATYATVSMIRDTKQLNITVRQIEHPDEVFATDFKVTLVDDNCLLGSDNALLPCDSVLYRPYAQWTSRFDHNGLTIEPENAVTDEDFVGEKDPDLQRTAHYNFMFNRLMFNKDINKSARLVLRNRKTDEVIANINLPYILAEGRDAFALYNYGAQEYLDREYDYHLDFFLKGDKWVYIIVDVNILGWSKRIQNVGL